MEIYRKQPVSFTAEPLQVWHSLRASPAFSSFVALVEQQAQRRLDEYILNEASDFNRGRVVEMKALLHFLNQGVIQ